MGFVWPWQQRDPETGIAIAQYDEPAGPLDRNGLFFPPTEEVEFNPIQTVQTVATKVVDTVSKATARMAGNPELSVPSKQQAEIPWYNVTGRIASTASSVNDAFQSTMIKVIVLVSIVGIIALFGMSYVQAKGAAYAK